jgi:hypothetical protein
VSNPFQALGKGLMSLGDIMDANAQSGSLRSQGLMEQQNERMLYRRAEQIGSEGARNEEALRRDYRRFAGNQAAAISESGLTNDGSALDVVRDSETQANMDALNLRYRATSEAQGATFQAQQAGMRSSLARQMAKRVRASGYLRAVGRFAGG